MEKSTGELMEILKSKKNFDDFCDAAADDLQFRTMSEYLNSLLSGKGLEKNEVIRRSGIERGYGYQLFNGTRPNPSRDKLLRLAFAMKLTVDETNRLLRMAKHGELYVRDLRDSLIMHALYNNRDLIKTNEELCDHKLDPLS